MNNKKKANPFQLPKGVIVEDLSGIFESYSIEKDPRGFYIFTINVSAPNIINVFLSLAKEVKTPGFILLEAGTHRDIENQLRKKSTDPFHKDVFYLDDLTWEKATQIINNYKYLFSEDGGINFGFGSHEGQDEVLVAAYKIFYIYTDEPSKYEATLNKLGYKKVEKVKTVWENFNSSSPGHRNVLTDAKPNIWDMIDELKKQGLYFAERRED